MFKEKSIIEGFKDASLLGKLGFIITMIVFVICAYSLMVIKNYILTIISFLMIYSIIMFLKECERVEK